MIAEDTVIQEDWAKSYPHPGKIQNDSLLITSIGGSLKPNILYDYHFIIVNTVIWKYLRAWYGATHEIERRIRRDLNNGKSYLDLYMKVNEMY